MENKRLWYERQQTFPEFNLSLISSCMQNWTDSDGAKYLHFCNIFKKFIIYIYIEVLSRVLLRIQERI